MSEKPKLEVVNEQLKAEGNPTSVFDDLSALRKASKLIVQRKAVLVNVTVDKPPSNAYFRCHRELMLDNATVLRDYEGTSRTNYSSSQACEPIATGATSAARNLSADQHLAERQRLDLASSHSR